MTQEQNQEKPKINKRQERKLKKQDQEKIKNTQKDNKNRIDDAKKIAAKSKKTIDSQYNSASSRVVRFVRKLNSWLDKIINSPSSSKLFALIIAVVFFISLIGINPSFLNTIASGDTIKDVPLQAIYNEEVYEVNGLPETVDLTLVGDRSSISATRSSGTYEAYVELSGLNEGKNYNIPVKYKGIVGDVRVFSTPTSVDVTIEKKISQSFELDYTYINKSKKDGMFILGTPTLDTTSVIVRASKETLNEISSVKVIIDASVVTQKGNYTQQSQVVAYDQQGLPLKVDILPKEVKASFDVTSPSKDVKINVIPQGNAKDGFAISSMVANNESTTIFAPQNILDKIDSIDVYVDIEGMSKDDKIITTVPLPPGVSKTTVSKVGVLVKFGPAVKETLTLPVKYINNPGYKVSTNDSPYSDVTVVGTRERIDALKKQLEESKDTPPISIYFDMAGLTPGRHDNVALHVKATDLALQLELVKNTISITISE